MGSDEDERCAEWARAGFCEREAYQAYMEASCAGSCVSVEPDAYQAYMDAECEQWVSAGYCEVDNKYKTFMNVHCKDECNAAESVALVRALENAEFVAGAINGADLANAIMRDAKLTVGLSNGKALIRFTATDFTKTDLRDAEMEFQDPYYGSYYREIEFTDTDLTNARERTGQKLNADIITGLGPSPPAWPEPPRRPMLPPPSLPKYFPRSPPPPPPPPYRYAEANAPRVPSELYTLANFRKRLALDTGEPRVTNTVGEANWSLCGGQAGVVHAVLIAYVIGIIFGLKNALTQSPLEYGESEPNESDGGDGRAGGSTGGESDGDESDGGGSDESDGDDGNKHDESERDESDGDESDGNDETAQEATQRLRSRMIKYHMEVDYDKAPNAYMKALEAIREAEAAREADEPAKAISASLHSLGNDDDDLSNFIAEDNEETDIYAQLPVLLPDSDEVEEDDEAEENDSEYDILSLSELPPSSTPPSPSTSTYPPRRRSM